MSVAIQNLPDSEFESKVWHQQQEWQLHRRFWTHVARRIDYLQLVQLGFCPDDSYDPCKNPLLSIVQAEWLDIFSSYHFRILQLLIANPENPTTGFSLIKEWARARRREFPFQNPRELFSQICRDQANSGWQINLEGNPTKKDIQKALQNKKRLFKGELKEADRVAICKSWEQEDWSLAWIPGIYNVRQMQPLREYWQKLDSAHDRLVTFICRKKVKDNTKILFFGRDKHGRPIDRELKSIVDFNELS